MAADRRVFLAALAAVAAAVAAATFGARFRPGGVRGRLPPAPAPLAERLIVIGDSYSQTASGKHNYPKWSKQLVTAGYAGSLTDLARGGMTAGDAGRPGLSTYCFRSAVDSLAAKTPVLGAGDVVVVYLGHLDLMAYKTPEYVDLARSKADYERELDRLLAMWPAGTRRRVILVKPHDRGWNRKDRPIVRPRTVEWNAWLAGMAAARPGVTTADVFAVVDQVLANPVAYGIEELKKRDPERSLTTWLMFDASHFGGRGQEIIATVVAAALSKA